MNEPKLTGKAAQRLLEEIAHQIELDKMIDEILPMSDEDVAEIEAQIAAMPPLSPEEELAEQESTKRITDYMREYRKAWGKTE